MENTLQKKRSPLWIIPDAIGRLISSVFFPFITAAVTLTCYYMGWDVFMFWYFSLTGAFMLLFMKDITPMITIFLFMNILVSMKNSPTTMDGNDNQYYFQAHILAQIGVAVAVFAGTGLIRGIADFRRGNFRLTPAFFGLVVFSVAMLFNGAFSKDYMPFTLAYGFFLAFLYLVPFTVGFGAVKLDKHTYARIAWAFIALSICLLVELLVAYCTYEGLWLEDGTLNRGKLYFGWGMYNTMGMLLVISMPSAAYLAVRYGKSRLSCIFSGYLSVLLIAACMTMSRQSILCGVPVFLICMVWVLVKAPHRWINGDVFLAMAVISLVAGWINFGLILSVWQKLTDDFFSGSGRVGLYREAFEAFLSNPLFGTGFYTGTKDPFIGLDIMPYMYHDTFFQLIGASGLFGLIAYVVHRIQTIVSYFRRPTRDRTFIALTLFALLILSLFDNHIFYLLPTLVYSFLVCIFIKAESGEAPATVKEEGEDEPSPRADADEPAPAPLAAGPERTAAGGIRVTLP